MKEMVRDSGVTKEEDKSTKGISQRRKRVGMELRNK
jgi:hypothetical protein